MRNPLAVVVIVAIVIVGAVMLIRAGGRDDSAAIDTAVGADVSRTPLAAADVTFLTMAAQAGQSEIALASLAEDTSERADVDSLADRLQRDHEATNDRIKELADRKNVDFPNDAIGLPGPTDAQRATRDRLAELKGQEFNRAWADQTVRDHEASIELWSRAANSTDADVKALADSTLPTLREHLEHAQALQKTLAVPAR